MPFHLQRMFGGWSKARTNATAIKHTLKWNFQKFWNRHGNRKQLSCFVSRHSEFHAILHEVSVKKKLKKCDCRNWRSLSSVLAVRQDKTRFFQPYSPLFSVQAKPGHLSESCVVKRDNWDSFEFVACYTFARIRVHRPLFMFRIDVL
jgi:hypothetical protein